jgi:hypothetical protein
MVLLLKIGVDSMTENQVNAINNFFTPIKVEGGRKFKGNGFCIGHYISDFSPYRGCHKRTVVAKIWSPKDNAVVFATASYIEVVEDNDIDINGEKNKFFKYVIESIENWTKEKEPDYTDIRRKEWVKNILKKRYENIITEILPFYDNM